MNRIPALAKELVGLQPDIIVIHGTTPGTAALQRETRTIPIVFANAGDPVASGIVPRLDRPGGNVTGFAANEATLGGNPEDSELTASFDERLVTYGFGELDTLIPAYAATIHKSQGSEYPAVVIPVQTQHYPMLQRNLLYTGVTRGKKLVVLVGQKKAVAIAVRNVSGRRRWSKLGEWLSQHIR